MRFHRGVALTWGMVQPINGYRRISKALLWISVLSILIRAFFLIYLMGVRQLFSKIQSRLIGFVFISDFKGVSAFGRRFKSFSDNDCDGLTMIKNLTHTLSRCFGLSALL